MDMIINQCNNYKIVSGDAAGLSEAAQRLRDGGLAAFPTETVYGLGASALEPSAVEKVFALKGRPFADPLIVHVLNAEMALSLCLLPPEWKESFQVLTRAFWPGPLTLIVPASPIVPKIVIGGGETVGIRCPAHPIALKIIELSKLPLAAPSANQFGHVSPTTAQHVAKDLGRDGLLIVDGGSCSVGIESTVLKIISEKEFLILRRGAVSAAAVVDAFEKCGLSVEVSVRNRFVRKDGPLDSPGELLIHYSPTLPAYLVRKDDFPKDVGEQIVLRKCGLIDLGKRFFEFSGQCGKYVDLSPEGHLEEACERVFSSLRNMEMCENIEAILVPDLSQNDLEMAQALADRLNRAAALKRAYFFNSYVRVDV